MPTSVILFLSAVGFMAIAFFISLAVTPLSILIAKRTGAIDVPADDRRLHKKPVPRIGGLAIFISFVIGILILRGLISGGLIMTAAGEGTTEMLGKLTAILVSCTIIFVLGLIDDYKNIRAVYKLLGQIGCSTIAFALGIRIPAIALLGWQFANDSPGGLFISYIVTIIWFVAITNMINLIDGLDGLAAGVSGIAALAIAYTASITGYSTTTFAMIVLAGAAFGFLPFNFYPAKVFMGDCGAMFLGFALAAVSIISPAKGATVVAIIAPVLVLGVPAFDAAFAMIRRRIRGQSIMKADGSHLHHQLTRIGMGQRRAALMLYGISGIMGIAAIVLTRDFYLEAIGLFLIAIVFIIVLIWGWNKNDT